jgi:hypothetical protein
MNISFESKIDPAPTFNHRSQSPSANTEFSEARHRLLLESRNLPAFDKAVCTVRNHSRQHQVSAGSPDLVEEAFYWFLTAPALVYMVYFAFGL